jgi:hypothetical protein
MKMQMEGVILDSLMIKRQIIGSSDHAEAQSEIQDDEFGTILDESLYNGREEWLLKFEMNESGVGRILLPPSLTVLLQSDRICIMPMGGGLFVKSV